MSVFTWTDDDDKNIHSEESVSLARELQLSRDLMAEADRIMRAGSRLMEYAMSVETKASRSFSEKAKKRIELEQEI